MARNKRVKRSSSDLKNELKEQVLLLIDSCESFDKGLLAKGKHIALTLRILLHHKGQSRSLLQQLGLRDKRFFDTAGPLNANNLIPECNLIGTRTTSDVGKYMAMVQFGESPLPVYKIKFSEWWNNPVLKDNKGRVFNRRELVTNVADTDGGAHADPYLEEPYMDLSRNNSLSWEFSNEKFTAAFEGRPELACVRQIAHEVLLTLKGTVH